MGGLAGINQEYGDQHGAPCYTNSVCWSEDNIIATVSGPSVIIDEPGTCSDTHKQRRCDGMSLHHNSFPTATIPKHISHVTYEEPEYGQIEVDGAYRGTGNPIKNLK